MQGKQIVIVGAGYAGLMCALRVAGKTKRLGAQVMLINGSDVFVERPLLHEVATNKVKDPIPLAHMIRGTNINFVQGWMTSMQPNENAITVNTSSGER